MAAIRARAARLFRYALAASLLGAIPRLGLGLAFAPTEAEWIMWPDYCKARYVVSASGQDSAQFAGRVDAVVVKAWERRLGTEVWYSLHHYCAGMLIAERAKRMSGPERQLALREAIGEYEFTLQRLPESHPMRAEVAARTAFAHQDLGQHDAAFRLLDDAIRACPECAAGYQAKAMLYRDAGKLAEARKTLEAALGSMGDRTSAEIHYLLGLVLLDLDELAAAEEHARRAYELGYPLPGLRERLAEARR